MTGLLRWFLVLLLTAGTANAALAQNMNSRLTGVVKDAQGAVLPGVAVTATSPALIGSQTATTEANGTFLFPQLPPGTYALSFELSGFQTGKRQNIGAGARRDAEHRHDHAAGDAAGKRHGHRRIADRRHAVDGRRIDARYRQAGGRSLVHGPVGRAGAGAGRADAGLRRRRQPQEPAVRLCRVRHLHPAPRGDRGRGHDRRAERRRLLPGLLLAERNRGQRGGPGRVDEHAGRGRDLHDQERRQRLPQHHQPDLRGQQLRGRQHELRHHQARRVGVAEHRVPGEPPRPRRSDRQGQALVLRRLQLLQDRQGHLGRRSGHRDRPDEQHQLHEQGNVEAVVEGHGDRLLPVAEEGQAAARPVGDAPERFHAGAVQPGLDVQRAVGARVVEPPLHAGERRRIRLHLPGTAVGRLQDQPAADRPGDGRRYGRRVHGRRHDGAVLARPRQAAGLRERDLLPADDERGEPRLEVRLRVAERHVELREQRHLGPDPLSGQQRRDRRNPPDRPRRSREAGLVVDDPR